MSFVYLVFFLEFLTDFIQYRSVISSFTMFLREKKMENVCKSAF